MTSDSQIHMSVCRLGNVNVTSESSVRGFLLELLYSEDEVWLSFGPEPVLFYSSVNDRRSSSDPELSVDQLTYLLDRLN